MGDRGHYLPSECPGHEWVVVDEPDEDGNALLQCIHCTQTIEGKVDQTSLITIIFWIAIVIVAIVLAYLYLHPNGGQAL